MSVLNCRAVKLVFSNLGPRKKYTNFRHYTSMSFAVIKVSKSQKVKSAIVTKILENQVKSVSNTLMFGIIVSTRLLFLTFFPSTRGHFIVSTGGIGLLPRLLWIDMFILVHSEIKKVCDFKQNFVLISNM